MGVMDPERYMVRAFPDQQSTQALPGQNPQKTAYCAETEGTARARASVQRSARRDRPEDAQYLPGPYRTWIHSCAASK
jgi:hypothetical protein